MPIDKNTFVEQLETLQQVIDREDVKQYFSEIMAEKYNLSFRLQQSIVHVKKVGCSSVNGERNPQRLVESIEKYVETHQLPLSNDQKSQLGQIVKQLTESISYWQSLGEIKIERTRKESDISEEIKSAKKRLRVISVRIESIKNSQAPISADKSVELKLLEAEKASLESKILYLNDEKATMKQDESTESAWNERIQEAFLQIEKELKELDKISSRMNIEVWVYSICLFILVAAAGFTFNNLFEKIAVLQINQGNIISLLPYYSPLPITIALFWVCIVQRNKAQKVYLSIKKELFNIKYLEGLLLMENKLAGTRTEAIGKIDEVVSKLMDNFLMRIENNGTMDVNSNQIQEFDIDGINKLVEQLSKLLKK